MSSGWITANSMESWVFSERSSIRRLNNGPPVSLKWKDLNDVSIFYHERLIKVYDIVQSANVDTDEEVTMEEVYNEVNEILMKHRVTEFRNRPVTKKYAFELTDVPRECDYLEVLYPYSSIALLKLS